jgi:glycosyltransferase involved in cell wall biosynthesis
MQAQTPATSASPSLLFISSDRFEPFRVDVRILFAQELVRRGYRIDWILQSENACNKSYRTQWRGGDAWVGKTDLGTTRLARLRKHVYAILNELRMFRLLRTKSYDCIVVKDTFITPLFALLAGRLNGVPVFYWLSYPFPEDSLLLAREGKARYPVFYLFRGLLFRFLLYRIILPHARHVFVQSEQMKLDVAAEGIAADTMTAVPMGVDIAGIPWSGPRPLRTPGRPPTLLYLGTLAKVRRLDFLIRVLALVRSEVPDAQLVLVGDGDDPSDRELLEAEAARLGVTEAVRCTGFIPMRSAWEIATDADVCLSPFYPTPILNSTSPTKLIEYMALGRPVVATDHPEQRLVIGASGAGLCVPWDEAEFAAAVVKLLADRALAEEMGVRGRRYVEKARDYRAIARLVDETFRAHLPRFAHSEPSGEQKSPTA